MITDWNWMLIDVLSRIIFSWCEDEDEEGEACYENYLWPVQNLVFVPHQICCNKNLLWTFFSESELIFLGSEATNAEALLCIRYTWGFIWYFPCVCALSVLYTSNFCVLPSCFLHVCVSAHFSFNWMLKEGTATRLDTNYARHLFSLHGTLTLVQFTKRAW